jgi:transcriptional regulator NrdR family protein
MMCPACGRARTKVKNSRTADSHHAHQVRTLVAIGRKWAAGPDFVARKRVCPKCGWKAYTVELLEADLERLRDTPCSSQ